MLPIVHFDDKEVPYIVTTFNISSSRPTYLVDCNVFMGQLNS